MSAQMFVICLAIAAIATITSEVSSTPALDPYASVNKSHSLIIGYRVPGDRLVLRQLVKYDVTSWMQIISVQKTVNAPKWERITQIRALDQKPDGNNANVTLIQGGPRYNNATLSLKGKRGYGINFIVEVFSRPY